MPNANQCINVDQNCGIDPNADQFRFRINAMILIGIDRHWSALGIDQGSPGTGAKYNSN